MRSTEEALEEAGKNLSQIRTDAQDYHIVFDRFLEERLMELDPEFMEGMNNIYEKSGMGKWYS